MQSLAAKRFRTAALAISAVRHNIVHEHLEDTQPVGGLAPQALKGLEPQRKNRPILPEAYPEEDPASMPAFHRTNSDESSLYNGTWDQSTQSYISQGQFVHPPPSHTGYPPSRPGYSGQHHSDPYPGQYQPAGLSNNHSGFPNQYPYGGASQQPNGHHQYSNQSFQYYQGTQGNPTQHQDCQQQYFNQVPANHQNHQQQMFYGQPQEIVHQVSSQYQQDSYTVLNNPTLRRASTTPVPYTCPHEVPKDSS